MRVNINKKKDARASDDGVHKVASLLILINTTRRKKKNLISPPWNNKKKYEIFTKGTRVNPIFFHSKPKLKKQQQQNETAVGNS